ncbi:MAG: hypothetical protein PW844_03185 [Pantoea sp.]|uniref:hypothetical protein n=1 Tax=Pantoea sp. TaxID=69393 RepID=UPI0023A1E41E|nr:hypothetical protein [Pantoea sp.]MDE1185475.1 hypothetical protein [Pantoea sp.]
MTQARSTERACFLLSELQADTRRDRTSGSGLTSPWAGIDTAEPVVAVKDIVDANIAIQHGAVTGNTFLTFSQMKENLKEAIGCSAVLRQSYRSIWILSARKYHIYMVFMFT